MSGTRRQVEAALTESVDMPQNLGKTSGGYVYRKSIPADVRHIVKQSEFKRSLGKGYRSARLECAKLEVHVTTMIEDARHTLAAQHSIDSYLKRSSDTRLRTIRADTDGLSGQVSALYLAGLDVGLEFRRARARDGDEFDQLSENIKNMPPRINRVIATGEVEPFFPVVSQLLLGHGYILDGTLDQIQTLTYNVLLSIQAGYRALTDRQEGKLLKPSVSSPAEALPAVWAPAADKKVKALKQAHKLSDVIPPLSDHLSTTGKNRITKIFSWQHFIESCSDKSLAEAFVADGFKFLDSRLKDKADPWGSGTMLKAKSLIRDGFSLAQTQGLCEKNPVLELMINVKISVQQEARRKRRECHSIPFTSTHSLTMTCTTQIRENRGEKCVVI
jgi:hypothetical protein